MREWRNLLTSTHVGYRSVIRAVASGASLKFGVQGASATNWFSRVNSARDNGIWLYYPTTSLCGGIIRHLFYATSSIIWNHQWIQTGVTVRKHLIWVKIGNFLSCVTLNSDRWPWKTTWHLFYATSSFVHHFKTISEFKLALQSGNTQFGSKLTIFVPCDLEIW